MNPSGQTEMANMALWKNEWIMYLTTATTVVAQVCFVELCLGLETEVYVSNIVLSLIDDGELVQP